MNTTLIFSSFVAGLLTALAPCVLPLLPVILGSTTLSKNPRNPFIVTIALGVSILFFTLILKVSTFFINVPQHFWTGVSGGIVLAFGVFLLFPSLWDSLSLKLGLDRYAHHGLLKATHTESILGSILVGAALGPVFSSCSPTYFLILATVLPANFLAGIFYLLIYVLGLVFILGLIAYFGQKIIKKLHWAASPNGPFKKIVGVLLILVGLLIATGYTSVIETKLLNSGYDISKLEQKLLGNEPPSNTQLPKQNMMIEKYQNYSPEKIAQAQTKGYHYAFFFHANWCSNCHALEKTILENIDKIPQRSVIFKVDYDTTHQLQKDLKVLTQSTVIFFDDKGHMIDHKINPSLDRIVQDLSGTPFKSVIKYQDPAVSMSLQKLKHAKYSFGTAKEYFAFLQNQKNLKQATFAGGCFWCMEGPFESEDGVAEAFNGYVGGAIVNPSYEQVSTGQTGAREAVLVFYDPRIISYTALLETYWRQIDPNDADGQFADRGTQYTTAIFYRDDEQKKIAQNSKKLLESSGKFSSVATQIIPLEPFYLAEEYHQDYYLKAAEHYRNYKIGSGREDNIKKNSSSFDAIFKQPQQPYNKPNDDKIKSMLNHQSYAVTQEGATEKPFDNAYWNNHAPGIYVDVVTGEPLFSSTDKFDSGTGWPSFTQPIDDHFIQEHQDTKLMMLRTEVKSKIGNSHLGHVFNDGPKEKGGLRYCINSAALRFIPLEKMKEEGYEKYLSLFNTWTWDRRT